jgi:3-dehydroquinate synthase
VRVELGERAYDVVVGRGTEGLAEALAGVTGGRPPVVITDDHVAPLHLERVRKALGGTLAEVVLPAGESHKGWESLRAVVDGVLGAGVDRRSVVVALGGGVVGDVAGLGAALALRGMRMVQLPTTLLAMVDSSVGGKTAINHARGKNLVGAFHQPSLVWADLDTLDTLPAVEVQAGLGEVLKTALVGDAGLLDLLERPDALEQLEEVVARCVATKASVVARDEREGGIRAWLNAGHTVGHGLETAYGHGRVPHGIAVAYGLLAETRWAVEEGICLDGDLPPRLHDLVRRLALPGLPGDLDRSAALAAMQVDKKARGDRMLLPVAVRAGEMRLLELPRRRLPELLDHLPS